ncbi:MAG: ribosome maturation factor RimP [Bacilli bacterium]|jgi:ribosome maturation factor RimP|nr:ribosome maturation factor RimP [Bacilli bacterium]
MLEKIKKNIEPIILEHELMLYDLEYVKEHNENILRIFVDKEGGIDLDDIVEITPLISVLMDDIDLINDEYLLEISSPGAEKKLNTRTHFDNSLNEYIYVELNNPIKGIESVMGYLIAVDDDHIKVKHFVKGVKKEIDIAWDNIKLAHQAVKF